MALEKPTRVTAQTKPDSASTSLSDPLSEPSERSSGSHEEYYAEMLDTVYGDPLTPHLSTDRPPLERHRTGVSLATVQTSDPTYEVDFSNDDPGDPRNWPLWYKGYILFAMSFATTTVVLYSSSYASGIPGMAEEFGIDSTVTPILGITTYLLGLATGSVVLAPLSEMYGRRPIYIVALSMFVLLVLPSALAHDLVTVLIVRFFCAIAGSALIANAPGTVNDIVVEEYRALAFSIWSIGPMNGPVIGPLVGGFIFEYLGWRWENWIVMFGGGVSLALTACVKESYAPAILRRRARARRKETADSKWWCRYDEKQAFWPVLKINLSRPFVMAVTEPICIFWNLYIAIVYAILYLCFTAYPIVFGRLRGFTPGLSGLAFCGIGAGSLITIACEPLIRRVINSQKHDPETGRPYPEAMVSIVCAAGLLIPAGELWFAWTCAPASIHWIWPILAGIPFGMGNCAVFIYASNYLVHSYGIYAASALAGNSVVRSVAGGALPLAAPSLYAALGPNWAATLLACLELAIAPIPFVFWKWGAGIRERSALISSMQADKTKQEARRAKAVARAEGRAGVDAGAAAGEKGHGAHQRAVVAEADRIRDYFS